MRKRTIVAVQVAVMLVVLTGFAALSVDVGAMYNAKADLQRTADAAALAPASRLAEWDDGSPMELARNAAPAHTRRNGVLGRGITMDSKEDVTFGRASFYEKSGTYHFAPGGEFSTAVRVRVRMTLGSPNGSLPPYFSRVFGFGKSEMQANGTTWGYMQNLGYGTADDAKGGLHDPCYDQAADSGTVRLTKYADRSDVNLEVALYEQGHKHSEVEALMSKEYDDDSTSTWPARVACALGPAYRNSGHGADPITGELPYYEKLGVPKVGNGNNWVGGGEAVFAQTIFGDSLTVPTDTWEDCINCTASTSTSACEANSNFRYRFEVKTFANFLMEKRRSNAQTPEFVDAPAQPMQAVKDAVNFMVNLIDDLDTDDQLSLEVYGTTGHPELDLTHDQSIGDRLTEMQAAHCDASTNMGAGMERGIEELSSVRARSMSRKVMIVLTDGNANIDASGRYSTEGAATYALEQAGMTAGDGIRIFAVSVGAGANTSLMSEIADIGGGERFHAEGSIDQYSAQLSAIFQRFVSKRPVELIQ
ncbi:MAG: VWA domain-containing protein [Phycisphaerales bacterium]|nr:MAG: VWA domain-containing protein [Phycisphaerales bacterium]